MPVTHLDLTENRVITTDTYVRQISSKNFFLRLPQDSGEL